jgi:uncharacterized phage protein (TIGR01671 family)
MSRVIKFRGYDPKTKKMYPIEQLSFHGAKTATLRFNPVVRRHIADISIMQFTGLTDQNGTEIYESDIIRFVNPTNAGQVEFSHGAFVIIWSNGTVSGLYGGLDQEAEVIGNFYQNPELLEAK